VITVHIKTSRPNVSWMISMCSIPKKRNEIPNQAQPLLSGVKTKEGIVLSCIFSIDRTEFLRRSFRITGYIPAQFTMVDIFKTTIGVFCRARGSVIVSPTLLHGAS